MFDKQTKQRYITQRELNNIPTTIAVNTFKKTESFEIELDKDVHSFTVFEIKNMYKTLNIRSLGSLRNINSLLKQYTEWALQEALVEDSQNHFEEITSADYTDCINAIAIKKRLITREEVLGYVERLTQPCDKFLFLACFEGIAGNDYCDIINLKIQDFDPDNCTVNLYSGRTMHVSKELIELARWSAQTFTYIGVNGTEKRERPLYDQDLIFKRFDSAMVLSTANIGRRVYTRFVKIFTWLGINDWMTINALTDSGFVCWIKGKCAQLDVPPSQYIKETGREMDEYLIDFESQFGLVLGISWFQKCKGYF